MNVPGRQFEQLVEKSENEYVPDTQLEQEVDEEIE